MDVNIPEVLAEIEATFYAYETALNQNDVTALINFFWQDAQAVRFGATENLYGWEHIVNFRQNRVAPPKRTLFNTRFTSFGYDYANANTEFQRADGLIGRQSQSWVRTSIGWRIVSAHVSFFPS